MPIGFSKDDTAKITLPCLPGVTFTSRFLTAAQAKRVERLWDEAWRDRSTAEADAKLNQAIREGVVGWEGLADADGNPVEFGDAALEEMSLRLKFAIVAEYPVSLLLTSAEKKA